MPVTTEETKPLAITLDQENGQNEQVAAPAPAPEKPISDEGSKTIVHASTNEAEVAALIKAASNKIWDKESLKAAVEMVEEEWNDPMKGIVKRVQQHNPMVTKRYDYRFIANNPNRVSTAVHQLHFIPVNRTNHPGTPLEMIKDGVGCVCFGSALLMFRPKQISAAVRKSNQERHLQRMNELEDKPNSDPRFYRADGELRVRSVEGEAYVQSEEGGDFSDLTRN